MDQYADQTLHHLLDAVAAQQPAPGGGCTAAWSGALGAGLVEMAASFTLARPKYAGVHRRMADLRKEAKGLRRDLVALGQRDAEVGYEPVLAALRLPEKHPERERRLEEARSQAADAPLAVAEATATVAELAAETARTGSAQLQGDAITGALLAEAATQAAARLVAINLVGRVDDRLGRAAEASRRATAARHEALRVREEVVR
ncbi:MAG TPA: cyclodeaminase/cyclohydrolase family protein [Solirubrobacteraceae bacterium]|nr:cyclodeaminase/cyclohydrolase family protein [Solirubrobacteraceae bacterium]